MNGSNTISSKTWSYKPQYTLCGSQTTQASNTVDTGTEVNPPVCTTEEWEKFCEEEGLEDVTGTTPYTNNFYTTAMQQTQRGNATISSITTTNGTVLNGTGVTISNLGNYYTTTAAKASIYTNYMKSKTFKLR